MNQNQAEAIATAVSIIRPAWLKTSLLSMLAKVRHRPARQVALALVSLAYDPEVQTPGVLLKDGPHWAVGTIGEPTYTPPAACERLCPTHGDRGESCRGCAADRKAATDEAELEPMPERMEGETLIGWARRVADAGNQQLHEPAATAATTEQELSE